MRVAHLILLWPVLRTIARPLPQSPPTTPPPPIYDPNVYYDQMAEEYYGDGSQVPEGGEGIELAGPLAGLGAAVAGLRWNPFKNGWNPLKPKNQPTAAAPDQSPAAPAQKKGLFNPFQKKANSPATAAAAPDTAGQVAAPKSRFSLPFQKKKTSSPGAAAAAPDTAGQVATPKSRFSLPFQKKASSPATAAAVPGTAGQVATPKSRFSLPFAFRMGKTTTTPPPSPQVAPPPAPAPDTAPPPTVPETKPPAVDPDRRTKTLPDLTDDELYEDLDPDERAKYERCRKNKWAASFTDGKGNRVVPYKMPQDPSHMKGLSAQELAAKTEEYQRDLKNRERWKASTEDLIDRECLKNARSDRHRAESMQRKGLRMLRKGEKMDDMLREMGKAPLMKMDLSHVPTVIAAGITSAARQVNPNAVAQGAARGAAQALSRGRGRMIPIGM